MWYSRSITNIASRTSLGLTGLAMAMGCASDPQKQILEGTIAYPFVERTEPLGRGSMDSDKFVIRSAVGNTEYTVEIPGAARDYDIEVPLADLGGKGTSGPMDDDISKSKPQVTDREFVSQFPRIKGADQQDAALTDAAFGVAAAGGPIQAPSYTLGVAKVTRLFQERKLEYALIEINNLLTFYPSSPRLHKMKGTVLIKMRDYELAESAWLRASELAPDDLRLKKAITSLQRKLAVRQPSPTVPSTTEAAAATPAH